MTKKYCRICGFPMDSPRDISHYRLCVRKRDWPEWVRSGGPVTASVVATLLPDGSDLPPIPPLAPLPEEQPEPAGFEFVPGATVALNAEDGTILCDCGKMSADKRAHLAHRRTSRLHREAVTA